MNLSSPKTALTAAAAALSLTGCGGPQQAGETATVFAAGVAYTGARILGADENSAALAALVLGGLAGTLAERNEPPCVEVVRGQRITQDYVLVRVRGQADLLCKPQGVGRSTAHGRYGLGLLDNEYNPPLFMSLNDFHGFLTENAALIRNIAESNNLNYEEIIAAMNQYVVVYTDAPKPKDPKV